MYLWMVGIEFILKFITLIGKCQSICTLLQSEPLCIPVQTIDWGHPNIRNGYAKEYKEEERLLGQENIN